MTRRKALILETLRQVERIPSGSSSGASIHIRVARELERTAISLRRAPRKANRYIKRGQVLKG